MSLFFTQPWSLFFLMLAVFSTMFPWYQKARTVRRWTLGFLPAMLLALSVPLLMMDSGVRTGIGVVMIAIGAWLLWRAHQRGWELPRATSTPGPGAVHIEPA